MDASGSGSPADLSFEEYILVFEIIAGLEANKAYLEVEPQEKKKQPKGSKSYHQSKARTRLIRKSILGAKKRIQYTRRFVNVASTGGGGKRKVCEYFIEWLTS